MVLPRYTRYSPCCRYSRRRVVVSSIVAAIQCTTVSEAVPLLPVVVVPPSPPSALLFPPPLGLLVFVRLYSAWVALPMSWPPGHAAGGFGPSWWSQGPVELGVPGEARGPRRSPLVHGSFASLGGDGAELGQVRSRLDLARATPPAAARFPSSRPSSSCGAVFLTGLLTRP